MYRKEGAARAVRAVHVVHQGHVRLVASMNPDAHPDPGYLNDAACAVRAVRGRHPQVSSPIRI